MLKTRVLTFSLLALLSGVAQLLAEDAAPKFEIQRATYEPVEGKGGADVTELVRGLVKDGVLSVVASNQALGGDPTPGIPKRLRVEYTLNGKKLTAVVAENQTLEIPELTPQQQAAKAFALLRSRAPREQKAAACRQLALAGGPEAIPALASLLCDEQLSHMARYALEPMPDPAVDVALRKALGECKGLPLVGILNSIGVRGQVKSVDAVIPFLQDADPEVASAAARTLGKLATVEAAAALEGALTATPAAVRPAVADGCLRCAERLAEQGQTQRAVALYDRLRTADQPNGVRVAATRGAILARGDQGIPVLLEQLHADELRLFHVGLRAALELPGAETTKAIAAELAKLPTDKQPSVMQALAKRGDKAALPALLAAAKSEEQALRLAALRALPPFRDPSTVPVFVAALSAADPDLAQAGRIGLQSLAGKEADAALAQLTASPRADLRAAAVEMIGQRRTPVVVPTLLKAAADADQSVRLAAFEGLRTAGEASHAPEVLALLVGAKSQDDIDAAEEALTAVCLRAPEPTANAGALVAALNNAAPPKKCAVLRVLAAVGGPLALKTVRAAVDETDAQVHAAAVKTLSNWATMDAAPTLFDLAKTAPAAGDRQVCLRGYLRLARDEDAPADQRLTMCQQAAPLVQDTGARKLLLGALGTIPLVGAAELAAPHLDEAATVAEASAAVVAIAEELIKSPEAPKLIVPLQKAADRTNNSDLQFRARSMLLRLGQAEPLFNGKDLAGWEGVKGFWSVKEGCLTGRTTAQRPTNGNTFLVWKGGNVSDFDLTYQAKLTPQDGKPAGQSFGNSGVQFRSKLIDRRKFVVSGYQADLATTVGFCGMLYEERGRGIVAKAGAKVLLKDKPEIVGTLGKAEDLLEGLDPTAWNDYRIVAKGNVIRLFVNGKQTVEVEDQGKAAAKSGVLALQLHAGAPMMVQFRELTLTPLK